MRTTPTNAGVTTETKGCVMTLREAIAALPEDGATKSRDYGRGYAQAVRDVLALLDNETLDKEAT